MSLSTVGDICLNRREHGATLLTALEMTALRKGGFLSPALHSPIRPRYKRDMDVGFSYFATHDSLFPGELARSIEDRGHESLFFAEHTHIPASRLTPYPEGKRLPRRYSHTMDLFVAMTAAAVATKRLRIGSSICLIVERDPIITAKQVASIDVLSGGRVELGVGAGWNREEMENHGTDPRTRMALMAERIAAMKAIWSEEEASFHGSYVDFDRIWCWPKPVQRYPPILVGGDGPTVLDRVLAFGDAWIPDFGPANLVERIEELRARSDRAISVTVVGVPADARELEALEGAGVRRVLHWLPSAGPGQIDRALDRFETAVADLYGE
jgi:probable F420-dependent oxidoreductase